MADRTRDLHRQVERNLKLLRYASAGARRRKKEYYSLIGLIRRVWPWFIVEECHLLMAGFLEAFRDGLMPLSMLFVCPRASKSLMSAVALPANYIGMNPTKQLMMASHTDDLAKDFSRNARDVVKMEEYREIYPLVVVRQDIHAASKWRTLQGGGMSAAGVATGIAGKGFHRGMIDDPTNEKTATRDVEIKRINDWYGPGFYSRRDPQDAAIHLTTTRWRKDDLAGFLMGKAKTDRHADQPHILRIPAIIDEATAELLNEQAGHPALSPRLDGKTSKYRFLAGDSFAPRRFPLAELERMRANNPKFEALYQQNPTHAEGTIFRRACWRRWAERVPPKCFLIIQSYDPNFEEDDRADNSYAARTTWGLFEWDGDGVPRVCCILLEAWRDRPSFPDLMTHLEMSYREFDADLVLIEKKASGHAMLHECRKRGIRRAAYKPLMKSKTVRASAASVVLDNGNVWYMDRPFAQPVIDELADFPAGDYDDWADSCSIVWTYMRVKYLKSPVEAEEHRAAEALQEHFEPAQIA